MAEESAQTVVAALTGSISAMPNLTDRLEAGIDVLDLAAAAARPQLMARTYPNSRFNGYDLSRRASPRPRRSKGLGNVRFEVRDVAELGERYNYDLITPST